MILDRVAWIALACLATGAVLLVLLVPHASSSPLYSGLGVVALLLTWAGLIRRGPRRRTGWVLLISGFAGFVVGDGVYLAEQATQLGPTRRLLMRCISPPTCSWRPVPWSWSAAAGTVEM